MLISQVDALIVRMQELREQAQQAALAPGPPGWAGADLGAALAAAAKDLSLAVTRARDATESWSMAERAAHASPEAQAVRASGPALPLELGETRELAARMHQGQTLLDGTSRFEHLRDVHATAYRFGLAIGLDADELRVLEHLAWLSQALGSTRLTRQDLVDLGYPENVIKRLIVLGQWSSENMGDAESVSEDVLTSTVARATVNVLLARAGGMPSPFVEACRASARQLGMGLDLEQTGVSC